MECVKKEVIEYKNIHHIFIYVRSYNRLFLIADYFILFW